MSRTALAIKLQSSARLTALTIGEVCRLINGRTYKKNELLYEGRYRVLRVGNFFTSDHWYFSDLELEEDKYCNKGDLLYAWSASFGPRIWSGDKTIFHYHIWKVDPDPQKILRDYLFYFFEWDKELIRKEQGTGATMIHVSKGSMEARAIPVPSLDGQKRIVAVLDQAFAALDRARAHAEANLINAEKLFGLEIANIRANPQPNWQVGTLGDLATVISGQHILAGDYNVQQRGIGYLTGPADFGKYSPIVKKWTEHPKRTARQGDILITVKGSGVGSTNVMVEDELAISRQLMAVRAKPALREFLAFVIEASREHFQSLANGAAIPGISRSDVLDFRIAVPSSDELPSLLCRLKAIKRLSETLADKYTDRLKDIATLRQSLLQKAFSGQLT